MAGLLGLLGAPDAVVVSQEHTVGDIQILELLAEP